MIEIHQGDIVSLSFDPTKGREQKGVRPAVVISGDAFHVSGLCIVCPLTTKLHSFFGDVLLKPSESNGLKEESEILVGHTRSVSRERIQKKIGSIHRTELESIFSGIDLVLNR